MKKTNRVFVEELKKINDNIIVIGDYNGARNKIKVKCKNCSNLWEAAPTNLLKGRGCPKCALESKALKRRKSDNQFIEELNKINNSITLLSTYRSTNKKVLVECNNCKHKWEVLPSSLLRGSGCPVCSRTGTSWVEQTILLCLKTLLKDEIVSRDRKTIGMELDIYIPNKRIAIEYGAWAWHKNKISRDNEKRRLCEEKGIHLIQIFDAYDGEEKFDKNIWCYEENISKKENDQIVKKIITRICNEIGIDFNIGNDDYEKILVDARLKSRKMTSEDLQKKVSEINPNLKVLSEYHDALTKVKVKCNDCGYVWDIIPASLLRGNNCPVCMIKKRSDKLRKSAQTFESEVKKLHPKLKICGEYSGTHNKILIHCEICGNSWFATPDSLFNGNGCPVCYKKKRIEENRIKNEKLFVKKLKKINPNIQMIGKYTLSNKKVLMRCNVCNNEWLVVPSSLIQGRGCPKCTLVNQIFRRTRGTQQYISQVNKINPNIEIIGEYKKSKDKIKVRCKKCNNEWYPVAESIIMGTGCPKCSGNEKKTQELFEKEMREKCPSIQVLGDYHNAKTNIKLRCKECGYVWECRPTNILTRKKCPNCKRSKK